MMRLLLFAQQLAAFRSGVGTYAHGLATGLAARGHRVTVAVPEGEEIAADGVRVVTVPRPRLDPTPGGWISLGRSFARVLEEEAGAHDLAHFTDGREAWPLRRPAIAVTGMANDSYAVDWRLPDYPRMQFSDRMSRSLYYRLLRATERRTYRKLDALLANSRHVAAALSAGYGIPEDRIRVVHYGLREGTQVPRVPLEGGPAILFAGGNFQRKGLPAVLAAAARLLPALPALRVHVAGRDRNQPALAAKARRLGLGEAVVFHGWQPNERLRGMMAGADLFVLPSLTEGFGLVYLEAMRAGTPVIATSLGGAREVFAQGEEAVFVHPCDVEGLANAIRRIASDPEAAERLRGGGRRAAGRFTVEAMAEGTEAAFEAALQRWGGRL
jgi:glycosyltransferase involved in cell wall biosynthesis